MRYEILNLEQL